MNILIDVQLVQDAHALALDLLIELLDIFNQLHVFHALFFLLAQLLVQLLQLLLAVLDLVLQHRLVLPDLLDLLLHARLVSSELHQGPDHVGGDVC